jgi:MFS family permease
VSKSARTPLLIIFLTVFIDLLGFGIVLPLLPRYAKSFQASGPTLGLLMASFSIMQLVFAPLWGRISDRVGRRPILILGLAGSALFYTLFGYCTSLGPGGRLLGLGVLPWLFLTRIGAGIAGATIPTAQAYIADVTGPQQRAAGMALIGAAFGIGFTFGPLLGAAFVPGDLSDFRQAGNPVAQALHLEESQLAQVDQAQSDYRQARHELGRSSNRQQRDRLKQQRDDRILAVMNDQQQAEWRRLNAPVSAPGYVAGALSFLALLSALFLLPESLSAGSQPQGRHWLDLSSLKQALGKPSIGLILLTTFLTTFAFAQFESTLSLLTDFLGMADRSNYLVFAYIGLVLTLSQGLLVRRLLPRVGELAMAVVGTVLMTVGLLAVAWAADRETTSGLYGVLPLAVVGFSATNPSLQSLLSRRTSADQQGGILGLGQSMSALARILGPVLGLSLSDSSILRPYQVGAGLMLASVLLTLILRKTPLAATAEAASEA